MDPITLEVTIDRPREAVFEYLADIANHAEFTDHFRTHWRLTREDSYGEGAGARFKVEQPRSRFGWGDVTLTELEPPHRIVERGRMGKFNRIRTLGIWELDQAGAGGTRVSYSYETLPDKPTDRFLEKLGARAWTRRKTAKGLKRLRSILEEDLDRGTRATIAGGARKPASAYRFTPAGEAITPVRDR